MSGLSVYARFLGLCYRAARTARISTRADRQAAEHGRAVRPAGTPPVVERAGGGRPLRILLLGNGPVENVGVTDHEHGFGARIADALRAGTGRPVHLTTIAGGDWDPGRLADDLHAAGLHWYDAVVVIAAYRPQMADVPLDAWRRYTERVRDTLLEAAGPEPVVQILALPWQDAAARAPKQWGGAFGDRVGAIAATADAVLEGHRQVVRLTLGAPGSAGEWVGPAFSGSTYLRWGAEVAEQLQARFGEPARERRGRTALD